MDSDVRQTLEEIGRQLDRSVFPRVRNGGLILPSEPAASFNPLGKELHHESEAKRRSAADARQGAGRRPWSPGGIRSAGRSWPSRAVAPFVGADAVNAYRHEVDALCAAYPGVRIWEQGEDFWLRAESALLHRLGRKVAFLVGVSGSKRFVRAWAFWDSPVGVTWIGPRHTNFPDGSICAYEPADGTWGFGKSLIELLDIYSVWALRHLHLEVVGRWPGPQAVAQPYERILELGDEERCGCGHGERSYASCCKEADLKRNRVTEAIAFGVFTGWRLRIPPDLIVQFALNRRQPPAIADFV